MKMTARPAAPTHLPHVKTIVESALAPEEGDTAGRRPGRKARGTPRRVGKV